MSKLTELLDELCPDGVEYRPLGELLAIRDSERRPVTKSDRVSGPYPYYGANGIQDYVNEYIFDGEFILLGEDGSVLTDDFRPVTTWAAGKIWVNNHAHVLAAKSDEISLRFSYYALTSTDIRQFVSGGSRAKLNQSGLRLISLPVPPLEVQQEIVRVLDAFTDLEQSLVSELELRKKQFDSVRRSVISDSQAAEKKVLRLREAESEGIVTLGRGKVISKKDIAANPGDYPVYSSSGAGNGEFGRYGNYMFDDERISWSVDGGGRLFYRPAHRYSVTNVSGWMTVNISDLQVKYLYYVLLSQWENESFDYTRKAHPSVIREVYAFSIPTIEIQDEVVSKLDSLESLIQSIEQEISLRRKQYEFYRDELLSFTPKKD